MVDPENSVRIATSTGGHFEPDALFVHATGFCKEVWQPVIERIVAEPFAWLSMDQRGHGDSGTGELPNNWDLLANDVLDVLGGRSGLIGVGHSSGGGVIARAEAFGPGAFRHLVLIEPIIFPPPYQRLDGPMSAGTRRRRRAFSSRNSAYERFASGPFQSWTREALDAYIDHGFRETEHGWELKCAPEVEADFYAEGLNHDTWDLVETLDVPVTLVAGERSSTHPTPHLDGHAARLRRVDVVVVPKAGHLVPMEKPGAIAGLIDGVLTAD